MDLVQLVDPMLEVLDFVRVADPPPAHILVRTQLQFKGVRPKRRLFQTVASQQGDPLQGVLTCHLQQVCDLVTVAKGACGEGRRHDDLLHSYVLGGVGVELPKPDHSVVLTREKRLPPSTLSSITGGTFQQKIGVYLAIEMVDEGA